MTRMAEQTGRTAKAMQMRRHAGHTGQHATGTEMRAGRTRRPWWRSGQH